MSDALIHAIDTVLAFLADAERGKASEKPLNDGVRLKTTEGEKAYLFETVGPKQWVHRNYVAK